MLYLRDIKISLFVVLAYCMPLSGIRRIIGRMDKLKSEYRPRKMQKVGIIPLLLIEQKNKRVNALLVMHKKPSSCRAVARCSAMHPGMWYIDKQTKSVYDFVIYTFKAVYLTF